MSQARFLEWQESLRITAGLLFVQGFRLPIAIPNTRDWLDASSHEVRWAEQLRRAAR